MVDVLEGRRKEEEDNTTSLMHLSLLVFYGICLKMRYLLVFGTPRGPGNSYQEFRGLKKIITKAMV
jgi:hypothetical protein